MGNYGLDTVDGLFGQNTVDWTLWMGHSEWDTLNGTLWTGQCGWDTVNGFLLDLDTQSFVNKGINWRSLFLDYRQEKSNIFYKEY